MLSSSDWADLEERARKARENAYCPYSRYAVGAALMDERGQVFSGCNVENVSFGATICAERVAIGNMVVGGGKSVQGMVLVTDDGGYPCGICLQNLLEFEDKLEGTQLLICGDTGGKKHGLRDLLPLAFECFSVEKEK